jgi:iron(III) transport system substrate-binding protein
VRNRNLSRRDVLRTSAGAAVGTVFPAPLKAAAPEATAVNPALIEAARKERTVAFYTAMEIPVAETLAKAFEARYPGIAVHVKRSGAERVFQRIGKEEEIRIHEVDVVCSTDAGHFVRWKREGLLAPYLPEDVAKNLPSEQIDPEGTYATVFALLSPIGYNTNLIKPEDAPKSFADLLDAKWKGKIVKANPGYSGTILTATLVLFRESRPTRCYECTVGVRSAEKARAWRACSTSRWCRARRAAVERAGCSGGGRVRCGGYSADHCS